MSPTREHFAATVPASSIVGGDYHPFSMDVEFNDDVTPTQRAAFRTAVARWLKVIVAGGPPMVAGGETIESLLILAKCKNLDRKGGLSANTDLDLAALRGSEAGPTASLPGKATITLDATDMKALDDQEAAAGVTEDATNIRRYRVDLIAHEIGHALGLSRPVWERKQLLDRDLQSGKPKFRGSAAQREFGLALGAQPTPVPLEVFGHDEQFIAHWRQAYFHSELMTFYLEDRPNLIGPVTVAALEDLGYRVNRAGAETKEIDFTGSTEVAAPAPIEGAARPTVLRSHRWLNCHVRAS